MSEQLPDQLHKACDFLEHWHCEHTHDIITRLSGERADILIVSDPQWRDRLAKFVSAVFESPDPFLLKLKEVHKAFGQLVEANEVDGKATPGLHRMMRNLLQGLLESLPPDTDEDFQTVPPPTTGALQ